MKKTAINPYAAGIIEDLKSVLNYHRTSGIDEYPATDEIVAVMHLKGSVPVGSRPTKSELPVGIFAGRSMRPIEPKVAKVVRPNLPVASLGDIHNEVAVCTGCTLSGQRIVPVAGRGGEKVRLLVVGDWLALEDGLQPPTGCIFGVEQDRMLGKMIDAIMLPRTQVFVTNIIKCGIPTSCQPKAEHVHACLSFLHRQIAILQPEVILTMGMIATRTLLNRRDPLSRLRGRIHTCVKPEERKIPLIATYHPTFLLQNPEMKKATWVDLQMLAKQLGLVLANG